MQIEDIIVIGGGLMGSSTAWQLSQYNAKVLLIEQQPSNYYAGSSIGVSRITRSLGVKNDIFSFLQKKTLKETKKLFDFLNGLDVKPVHRMRDLYSTSPVSYIYSKAAAKEIEKFNFKEQKKKYKKAAGDAAFRKFGVTLPDSQIMVQEYQKYSGTFNPKALIKKLHLGIKKHGNKILYQHKVTSIRRDKVGYVVKLKHTETGVTSKIFAKKLAIAAGPYVVPLLRRIAPYWRKLVIPKKLLLCYFKIKKEKYEQLTKAQRNSILRAHPVFSQIGQMYFAMVDQVSKKGSPIFKVGEHLTRSNVPDIDAVWKLPARSKEIKQHKKNFVKYLRMLEIPIEKEDIICERANYCLYTMSNNKIPYVTHVIDKKAIVDKNIVAITGMSGTGAKGCLAYGLLAADLLLDINNSSKIYQKAKKALGTERLMQERLGNFF